MIILKSQKSKIANLCAKRRIYLVHIDSILCLKKNRLIAEKRSQEEILNVLSSFDKANNDILNEIIIGFRIASEQNIKSTNEQLSAFSANMHWDLGFMLKIISIGFSKLEKTSVSNKKKLLNEIEALVVKYCELSDDQNRIETY